MRISAPLLLGSLISPAVSAQRAIQLDVQAEWPVHVGDTAAQVAEFVADFSPELFWPFVQSCCAAGGGAGCDEGAAAAAEALLPAGAQHLLETSVGLGTYAPAVRFFASLAEDYGNPCGGEAFAVAFPGDAVHCRGSSSGAAGAVSFAFEQTGRLDVSGDSPAPWDHNYPGPAAETDAETEVRRHVVLYGVIGTPSFCAWHEELAAGAAGGAFRYSARPAAAGPEPAIAAARALQGYGVHLDIKNMEYRNLDDSSAQGGDSAAAAQDSPFPSQEVKGINFRKLHERHPDLEAGLVRAHEELVRLEQEEIRRGAVSSSADSMKAWKVADLGYQTVLSIATSDDPAWRMEQLLHNFPSQANSLSNLKVSPEAKQVLSDLHTNGVANTLPFNSILVNGVAMDISAATFGAYDLLESIKEEYRRQSELSGFRLGPRALAAVKAAAARVSSSLASPGGSQAQGAPPDMRSVVRVDVSRGGKNVVQFVNNLEKDAMYMNNAYSRSVKTLMQPSWSLHMIAKNLYTLVAVVDITTPNGRNLLGSLQGIYERQYPIRLGVVFATSEADDLSLANRNEDMPATASDILRVFEHVKGAVDLAAALELAFAVSGRMEEAFEHSGARAAYTLSPDGSLVKNPAHAGRPAVLLTRQQLVRQTAQFLQSHGVPAGEDGLYAVLMGAGEPLSADGPGLVQETREYLSQRGLPPDSFSFNGVVVESADVEGQLMALLGREQYFLGLMVQRGQISDRTRSIFNHVLKHSKVHNRYHSILNEQRPLYASPLKSPLMQLAESSAYLRHPSTPARCSDHIAPVSSTAANTVMLLFPLTQPGVQSAAAAVEWVWARNTTADPRGARLALVPLLPDGATETEVALAYALHRLVELVGATEGERDRLQALRWVPAFLRVMEAARGGSLKAASQAFLDAAREAAEPMSGELTAVLDTYVEGELGGEAQLSDMLRRQAWALSVIDSVEAAALEAAEDAAETPSGDACGTGNAKACNKNTYVLFNGRVMRAQRAPLHALDLEMLGQMAAEGVSEPLLASLGGAGGEAVAVTVADLLPADSAVPDGAPLQSAVDDLFLSMAAFCGSSAVGGPVRVDVKEMLASLGLYRKSVSGVAKYFPHLSGDPAAYVAPAELFSVQLAPPRAAEAGADDAVAITVVVNPLTQAGQRAAAMVRLCLDHLQLPVHLVLIPPFDVPEFPIKNYYRFVASPVVAAAGAPSAAAVASFRQMPRAQIFTVRMDVPEAWNVQATHSPQDIDNLVCDARSCGDAPASDTSYVTYTLKNLLVAGQCYEQGGDARSATPPNGLQLTLDAVRKNNAHLFPQNTTGALGAVRDSRVHSDTLVMQNLGYFQLQADAGMYFLRLAEGKARALYSMESEGLLFGPAGGDIGEEEGDEAEEDEDDESEEEEDGMAAALRAATGGPSVGIPVPVMSFGEAVLQLKVRKRAGMEHVPLLEDPDRKPSRSIRHKRKGEAVSEEDGGVVDSVWSSLSSMFGGAQPAAPASNETIHVFSLATGHVYERLLRIMMLSVSKRTKSPLKFWLFENYLSPTFKLLAGEMARKYGFEIGYVTYKWPKWLTEQTNKQRIIWGYKILFLDVLFPLNVKKVIYVDADQTVRADLKELWDMDLNGKPYGYVPFCSSRKETLGYQFWRSGYWENHLAGKPYHISALYVVDLTVFRRYAVGDRLRAVYDQLARDPNSLANLDQDLPNFAQHTVPIHSLPQEWLWCETWCSDKSKSKAKTIDLCNNPDKKEPKLDMARRIISGSLFKESWVELDDEVRALGVDSGITVRAD